MNFFALGAPSEDLQNLFEVQRQYNDLQRSYVVECKLVVCANPHHAHDPLHLEKAYLAHSFINLNDFLLHWMHHLRPYKKIWRPNKIYWHPNILSCRMQTSHMCQPTSCPWPHSLGKGISYSFLYRFAWFLLHKMHQMKGYKMFLSSKNNKAIHKDL